MGSGAPNASGPGVNPNGMQLPPGVDPVPSAGGITSINGSQPSSAGFNAMSSIAQ